MDCALAGAEWQHGRPLNGIVRSHEMAICPHCRKDTISFFAGQLSWRKTVPLKCPECGGISYRDYRRGGLTEPLTGTQIASTVVGAVGPIVWFGLMIWYR